MAHTLDFCAKPLIPSMSTRHQTWRSPDKQIQTVKLCRLLCPYNSVVMLKSGGQVHIMCVHELMQDTGLLAISDTACVMLFRTMRSKIYSQIGVCGINERSVAD